MALARVTQVTLEILSRNIPKVRATQVTLEVLSRNIPRVRVTQASLEVLSRQNIPVVEAIPDFAYFQLAVRVIACFGGVSFLWI